MMTNLHHDQAHEQKKWNEQSECRPCLNELIAAIAESHDSDHQEEIGSDAGVESSILRSERQRGGIGHDFLGEFLLTV